MKKDLKLLYKRFNQFGEYTSSYTILHQYTIIQIYKELKKRDVDIEKMICDLEINPATSIYGEPKELVYETKDVQPKSMIHRLYYLDIISSSLPDHFFREIGICADSIVEITISIALYYLGLQTWSFTDKNSNSTIKNIIGRKDFYIGLPELKIVRWKTSADELEQYQRLFACNIEHCSPDKEALFLDGKEMFILCIDEFLDYILFQLEQLFKDNASEQDLANYYAVKGQAFEKLVFSAISPFFTEKYHTLFYYPNAQQKVEIDILIKNADNIAILECKSGTINTYGIQDEEVLRLHISNKTKKAYRSLKRVADYIYHNNNYSFWANGKEILCRDKNPICIHVTMYPMDFISSNLHTLFPEYLHEDNPIITISLEHLFAVLLDAHQSKTDVFDYWKQRKNDIIKHPLMRFDNNELDLYYELKSNKSETMLMEIKQNGILDLINPNAKIISTFHDSKGNEVRPAQMLLQKVDSLLIPDILSRGKTLYCLNKRYLRDMKELLTISL